MLLQTFTYYISALIIISFITLFLDHTHFSGLEKEESEHHSLLQKYFNRMYFCSTTLSTVGYGDIVPKTTSARAIAIILQFIATVGILSIVSSSST